MTSAIGQRAVWIEQLFMAYGTYEFIVMAKPASFVLPMNPASYCTNS